MMNNSKYTFKDNQLFVEDTVMFKYYIEGAFK